MNGTFAAINEAYYYEWLMLDVVSGDLPSWSNIQAGKALLNTTYTNWYALVSATVGTSANSSDFFNETTSALVSID